MRPQGQQSRCLNPWLTAFRFFACPALVMPASGRSIRGPGKFFSSSPLPALSAALVLHHCARAVLICKVSRHQARRSPEGQFIHDRRAKAGRLCPSCAHSETWAQPQGRLLAKLLILWGIWWAHKGSNLGPLPCEGKAQGDLSGVAGVSRLSCRAKGRGAGDGGQADPDRDSPSSSSSPRWRGASLVPPSPGPGRPGSRTGGFKRPAQKIHGWASGSPF
jgi:hypothetical protein